MKTKYSAEFRLEVVQYQLKGRSKVEAARKFGINPSSAERWLVLYGQNGKDSLDNVTRYAVSPRPSHLFQPKLGVSTEFGSYRAVSTFFSFKLLFYNDFYLTVVN